MIYIVVNESLDYLAHNLQKWNVKLVFFDYIQLISKPKTSLSRIKTSGDPYIAPCDVYVFYPKFTTPHHLMVIETLEYINTYGFFNIFIM
jgi:hypothetical protein